MDFLTTVPKVPPPIISRVMAEVGFPVVSFEDLGITENDALELFIFPAMQYYFAYNPKQIKTSHKINGTVEIPFPNENVFGILQARIAIEGSNSVLEGTGIGGSLQYNPFRPQRSLGLQGGNRWNPYDNPYYRPEVYLSERITRMSYISLSKAGNMEIDRDARVLRGFSSIGGELVVTWAECSSDWKDVRFEFEGDVVNLAKAHALRYFGMLNTQMDPNAGVQMNGDVFITRANEMEEKVFERFRDRTKVVVSR
jgi:hypothetical protein